MHLRSPRALMFALLGTLFAARLFAQTPTSQGADSQVAEAPVRAALERCASHLVYNRISVELSLRVTRDGSVGALTGASRALIAHSNPDPWIGRYALSPAARGCLFRELRGLRFSPGAARTVRLSVARGAGGSALQSGL